jgi:cytochrome P450
MATQTQTKKRAEAAPERSEKSITIKVPEGALLPTGLLPPTFEAEYVAGVVAPFLLSGRYIGESPSLPMIDLVFSKEKAIDAHMWGLVYDGWAPNPEEEGVSVFIRGYENRGPNNERKRIYTSATTPDLVANKYHGKVTRFWEELFANANAGKPLMKQFYQSYFDLYWDLHVGVRGDAVPTEVRQFGSSFNAVLGFGFPTTEVVHENYMRARATRQPLKDWLDARVQAIIDGKVADADRTFVYYWLKNGELGDNFRRKDIVFECFHNLLAFSQWGNTTYNVMARLEPTHGDPAARGWFEKTMKSGPDKADGSAFTPLDRFVMELFRTISPNAGSLSVLPRRRALSGAEFSTIITPHPETSNAPYHWTNPLEFDPERYKTAQTSVDNDEARVKQIGLARCPFSKAPFAVKDGRKVEMTNSAFGAVYPVIDGREYPICEAGGYAPFGFGYRRCAGEQLTVEFIKEGLRQAWKDKISFVKLDLKAPEILPVGPGTVINDDIGFKPAK